MLTAAQEECKQIFPAVPCPARQGGDGKKRDMRFSMSLFLVEISGIEPLTS